MGINSTRIKNKLSQQFYRPSKRGFLPAGLNMDSFDDVEKAIDKSIGGLLGRKKKKKDKEQDKDKEKDKDEESS